MNRILFASIIVLCFATACAPKKANEQLEPVSTLPASTLVAEQEVTPNKPDYQYLENLRAEFRLNKALLVSDAMRLTPEESEKFWTVYGEYEGELKSFGDKRIKLLSEYAANYSSMTQNKAKLLLADSFSIQEGILSLRKQYAKKLEKNISPIVAARFAQVEQQIQLIVDAELAARVPLIADSFEQ